MRKIIITLFLLIGTIAYGQTHGDVSLSKTADIKKHFTKDVCDKILTDTFLEIAEEMPKMNTLWGSYE